MFLYTILTIPAAIILGILIAKPSKKIKFSELKTLDKTGYITNIILIPVYGFTLTFAMFLGMISTASKDGFYGILGWIISIIIASPALFCGLGLGASVSLRKNGKSVSSFIVQFLGVIGIVLSFVLYSIFEGNLINTLN